MGVYHRPVSWAVSAIALLALFSGTRRAQSESGATPPAARTYVGSEVCRGCHPQAYQTFHVTEMGRIFLNAPRNAAERLGCESCHGPGSAHVQNPSPATIFTFGPPWTNPAVKEMDERCRQCHTKGDHLFWEGSVHQRRKVACVQCHAVHRPASEENALTRRTQSELCGQCHAMRKAQLLRSSHMPQREGKITCGDCHNPHGSPTEKLIRGKSINDNCYSCHQSKRGPFLWEHAPVRENCVSCHEPHGSMHDKLLKMKRERLCQTCHIENRHPTQPHGPLSRFNFNRSCQNCHMAVHGSNHPAGEFFLR